MVLLITGLDINNNDIYSVNLSNTGTEFIMGEMDNKGNKKPVLFKSGEDLLDVMINIIIENAYKMGCKIEWYKFQLLELHISFKITGYNRCRFISYEPLTQLSIVCLDYRHMPFQRIDIDKSNSYFYVGCFNKNDNYAFEKYSGDIDITKIIDELCGAGKTVYYKIRLYDFNTTIMTNSIGRV